jgi:predicted PurR-regulated permease PerM
MFGWLNGLLSWGISGLDDLWKKVISIFQSIVSYVDNLIGQVVVDINSVWQWLGNYVTEMNAFVNSVYTSLLNFAVTSLSNLQKWVSELWSELRNEITATQAWATSWINRIYHDVTGWINQVENWVSQDIWAPLYNLVTGALRWISTEGTWVLYLLTHPDQLALVLGRYVLSSWLSLGHKYAKPVARWMLHSMLSVADDAVGVIEDFIAGIL